MQLALEAFGEAGEGGLTWADLQKRIGYDEYTHVARQGKRLLAQPGYVKVHPTIRHRKIITDEGVAMRKRLAGE